MTPRWLALLALVAGCGKPLATGGYKPPYVTLHGEIASTLTTTPAHVLVALLWQNDGAGANYAVQLLSVSPQFPVRFSVDVDELPPPSVMHAIAPADARALGIDPAMRFAFGTLIVFADDGDGKFDIVDPSRMTSPDRVLAAASDLDVFYLGRGAPAPSELVGIVPTAPGFSFVSEPSQRDPLPGECGKFTSRGHLTSLCEPQPASLPQPFDAASTIALTLVDDPLLQRYGCATFLGPLDYADWRKPGAGSVCDGGACPFCQGYQCPLDLPPAGVRASCNADGTAYVYKTCSDDPSLCGTRFCHYGHGERQATDPIPAGWPCP